MKKRQYILTVHTGLSKPFTTRVDWTLSEKQGFLSTARAMGWSASTRVVPYSEIVKIST